MSSDDLSLALSPLKQITADQTANAQQMAVYMQQMCAVVAALDRQIKALEKLSAQQRVTINSKQAKALQKRVQSRCRSLCDKYDFPYQECGESFRRALWGELKVQYAVDDVHDLPAQYFDLACSFVDGWTSFQTVRRLRTRRGG